MPLRNALPSVLMLAVAASFLGLLASEYTSAGPGGTPPVHSMAAAKVAKSAAEAAAEAVPKEPQRLREGDTLNQLGQVKVVGDRVLFQTTSGQQFVLLENLLVQRMADMMKKTDEAVEWSVTGMVTEFYGKNFLLLTHAVRKTPPRPVGIPTETPPLPKPAPDPRAF